MFSTLLNILCPESCPLCHRRSSDHDISPICNDCWKNILPHDGGCCQKCGRPFVSDVTTTCSDCIRDEPAFINARSFGTYHGTLREAINLFKYRGIRRLAGPLSDVMLHINIPAVDAVIPVPLYRKRLRKREFNQSALLAKKIAEKLGTSLVLDCLVKVRDTAPQVGLNAKARRKNIRGAFKVKNSSYIENRDVLLIDDVFTTGATARECAGVLKKAGAGAVHVVTLVHGVRD